MPGTNAGTGYPLVLRCAKCKVLRDYRSFAHEDTHKGMNLEATGRSKPMKNRGYRQSKLKIEYRCRDCGHVGWSQHSDAEALLLKKSAGGTG